MLENFDWLLVREIISCVLILTGVVFMLISTLGLLRLPDFYIRMSAITKGTTLGLGLILSGMGIYFNQPDILLKVLAIIVFSFFTAPVAAHVVGRTAVQNKIPFWDRTNTKELKDYVKQENLVEHENRDSYIEEFRKNKGAPDDQ